MVGLTPWFAPVEWASGPPCPLSCGHLPAERMPPGMAAWQAGGSLHKRAPTPALVFRPCLLAATHVRGTLADRPIAARHILNESRRFSRRAAGQQEGRPGGPPHWADDRFLSSAFGSFPAVRSLAPPE